MAIDVVIPKIGESVATVLIARWRVAPGGAVTEGEPMLDIDSDKASMEVPAPVTGVVLELLAGEGDEVAVSAVVAPSVADHDGAVVTPLEISTWPSATAASFASAVAPDA